VIDASQSAILISSEDQRSTTVRTGLIDQADAALGIPEGDQVFPEQPDALGLSVFDEVRRRQERNPIKAKELAQGRAFSDPHQPFIVFAREHELPP